MMSLLTIFSKSEKKKINEKQALHIAESEIIKKGLNLHDVQLMEPELENSNDRTYWSIKYADENQEQNEIILSEYGDVLRDKLSEEDALKLAKKEFERRGLDLVRLNLKEESKKINGREYWVVKYTTSFGFSDSLLVSKKTGMISY